jgi:ADP-ribose pyrophosphatase YjhB (NUDIX family)
LPVQTGRENQITHVGLIHRDTPHQGRRWCLVGGRLWRNESFAEAATRQIGETLGPGAQFHIHPDPQPAYVAQYFTHQRETGLLDPRQHAVAMVFVVPISGEIVAGGEACAFRWFASSELPPPAEWGFGQDRVAAACLDRLI